MFSTSNNKIEATTHECHTAMSTEICASRFEGSSLLSNLKVSWIETLAWTSSGVGMGHLLQTRRIFWEENHNASRSWWRDIDAVGLRHWVTIDFFCNGPYKSCTVLVVSCFLLQTKGLLGPFWQAIRTQGKHNLVETSRYLWENRFRRKQLCCNWLVKLWLTSFHWLQANHQLLVHSAPRKTENADVHSMFHPDRPFWRLLC